MTSLNGKRGGGKKLGGSVQPGTELLLLILKES